MNIHSSENSFVVQKKKPENQAFDEHNNSSL